MIRPLIGILLGYATGIAVAATLLPPNSVALGALTGFGVTILGYAAGVIWQILHEEGE